MELSRRDHAILAFTSRFKAVTSKQIHAVLFDDVTKTPTDRALRRLVNLKLLRRYERLIPGGARGGSGQYVYYLYRSTIKRGHLWHTLAIVDTYVALLRLERAGVITITDYETEPDNWITVGKVGLRPDLYVEVTRQSGRGLRLWLEQDMSSEGTKQLQERLDAYYAAYRGFNEADELRWGGWFPRTVFIVEHDDRAAWLTRLIHRQPEEARPLFDVVTPSTLSTLFK